MLIEGTDLVMLFVLMVSIVVNRPRRPQLLPSHACALQPADLPPLEARVNICAEIELKELHLRRARHLLR